MVKLFLVKVNLHVYIIGKLLQLWIITSIRVVLWINISLLHLTAIVKVLGSTGYEFSATYAKGD